MRLTALKVKQAKHPGGSAPKKLGDGQGLYLLLHPNGSKIWKFRYTFGNQRPELTFGAYPDISLAKARQMASEARAKLAEGIDPREERRAAKRKHLHTFDVIALEWWEKQSSNWSDGYVAKVRRWLERDVFPVIGKLPVEDIDPQHITEIMLGIEAAGHPKSAGPTLAVINRIFGYALAHRWTRTNPAQGFPLRDILKPLPRTVHRAAITDPQQLGQLLRDIWAWNSGAYSTVMSLRLIPYVFLRTKEIRFLRWDYVDFSSRLIRIPHHEMKKKREHLVPMAEQVESLLREIKSVTGYSEFVFPSNSCSQKPMSKNVITNALRTLGYGSEVMCGHGFRSSASTLLHEQGWQHEVIEAQLAHLTGSETSRAYDRSKYITERKKMMQAWADYLDHLRDGEQ